MFPFRWSARRDPARSRPMSALLRFTRPHRGALVTTLVLTLLASGTGLAQPLVARHALDTLAAGGVVSGAVILLAALMLGTAGINGGNVWLQQRTAERVVRQVRRLIAFRLIRLSVAEFDRCAPGDLISRVTSDSTLLQNAVTGGLVMVVNGAFTLVGALALMAFIQLWLFLATMGVVGVVAVAVLVVLPGIRRTATGVQTAVGHVNADLDRVLGAIRTVKAHGGEARETATLDAAIDRAYRLGLVGARYRAGVSMISSTSVQLTFLVVLGFGGYLVTTGALTVSALIAFLLYVFYLAGPVTSLAGGLSALQQGLGATVRISEVESMPLEEDLEPVPAAAEVPAAPRIDISGVCFSYPHRRPALRNVSITIEARSRTAIVGPSGAGKSTLFALLLRFYEPGLGSICLDGTDIAAMTRADVRRRIAYVEQDAPMMDGTIRQNLTYGRPEADAGEIAEVLHDSRLNDLVDRLPDGLDTPIGTRGVALSGGERQRLAIARALLRRPHILLLDEATAQLDTRNEMAMREVVDRVSARCTVVLIAHRLSTVTSADQIVVLEHGLVRATGTHSSLLRDDALYRELAVTQLLPDSAPTAIS